MILAMRLAMRPRSRCSEPAGRARRNISRIWVVVSREASRLGRSARDEEGGRARGEGTRWQQHGRRHVRGGSRFAGCDVAAKETLLVAGQFANGAIADARLPS